jgi:hypothetical protein
MSQNWSYYFVKNNLEMKKYLFYLAVLAFIVHSYSCGKKDDSKPPVITVVVSPASSQISSETGSSATIEVISSAVMPSDAVAVIEVVAGSAPQSEYSTMPALADNKINVNLAKGSNKASFTVTATKNDAQTDRTVTFRLVSVAGANLGPNTQHVVSIKGKTKPDPGPSVKTAAQIAALDSGTLMVVGEKIAGIVVLAKDNIATNNLVLQNTNTNPGIIVRFETANTFVAGDSLVITFAQGDYVRTFQGSKQLNVKIANVTKVNSGNVIIPKTITMTQLLSRAFENTLIRIENAAFDAGQGTLSGNKIFKVGTQSSRTFTTAAASFASEPVPSGTGTIVGVAGFFQTSTQISLRSVADLIGFTTVEPGGPVTLTGFGDVKKYSKTDKIKAGVKLTGIVTLSKTNINIANLYIQDNTGGTVVRFLVRMNATTGITEMPFEIGDELEFTTTDSTYIDAFNGQKQIFAKTSDMKKIASGKTVTPRTVTIAQFNARTYEGELLKIENITFDDANGTNKYYSSGTGTNRKFTSGSDKGELRTNSNAAFKDEFLPSGTHDLIGVAGSFSGTAQLFMRTKDDAVKK